MHLFFWLVLWSGSAFAQWQQAHWLHLDGAYIQQLQKEDGGSSLTTNRAGARGELGLALTQFLAVSGAAGYHDGSGTVADSPTINAKTAANFAGYASDTRALVHLTYRPFVLSSGLAQFESSDNISPLFRARTKFSYKPVMLTLHWGATYVRYEYDINVKGSATRSYSDLGGGREDVKFPLGKVRGQALELGVLLPAAKYATRVFASYSRWIIDAGEDRSDGVETQRLLRTEISTLMGGLGLAF